MTATWLPSALISLFSFGLWGLFTKLSITYIDSKSALIYQTIGIVVISVFALSTMNFKPASDVKGLSYAVLTGAAYAVGCFFYFIAASKGKITSVVTLTSLYPLITILFSFLLLKESITMKQSFGIILALVAIYFMST